MLVLPQELTLAEASACTHMLVQALRTEQGTAVVADASALTRFDSSALAVLLECTRETEVIGKTFSVRSLPAPLRQLATLYGVAALLPAAS